MAVIASTSAGAERHEIVCSAWKHAEASHKQAGDNTRIIYNISPMDTVALTKFSRTRVASTLHEWQIDSLAVASESNAHLEGSSFSAAAMSNTTRIKNYTQISMKEIVVSGTFQAVDKAGMPDAMGYFVAKMGKELKRDMEAAILSRNGATAGAAASARLSAGMQTYCETSLHIHSSSSLATTTAWLSGGIPNSTPVQGSATTTAFTSALLETALAVAWANGGEVDMILMSYTQKARFNTFTGVATRFREVGSKQQAQVVGAADVYVSSFGDHAVMLSRYIEPEVVLCIDTSQWAVGYLRPMQTKDVARIGDGERKMLLAEWTLIGKQPQSTVKITALTA